MSWNDVVIGEGHKGNSAVILLGETGGISISHNSVSYWISNVYLGMGMTIFKDTPEGRNLTDLISAKAAIQDLKAVLQDELLTRVHTDVLKDAVEAEVSMAYQRGWESRAELIREALGI